MPASGYGTPTFEGPDDFEREDLGLHRWDGQMGVVRGREPVAPGDHGDLAELAGERPELQWDTSPVPPKCAGRSAARRLLPAPAPGQRILVGDVELEVLKGCTRCVMTTRAQPGGIERQLDILRHVIAAHDNQVGFRASVVREGTVRVGDTCERDRLPAGQNDRALARPAGAEGLFKPLLDSVEPAEWSGPAAERDRGEPGDAALVGDRGQSVDHFDVSRLRRTGSRTLRSRRRKSASTGR